MGIAKGSRNMRVDLLAPSEQEPGAIFRSEHVPPESVSYRIDRFEMKFVITPAQRAVLMVKLESRLRPDVNGGDGPTYPIVSLYYDNDERDCYWEKVRGVASRKKLRVRVYGSSDGRVPPTAFIEVKHKCEGRGVKRRVQLPIEQALRIGEGLWPDGLNLGELDRRVIREVHDIVDRRKFRPALVMRYTRSAYCSSDSASDLRVTFDTGIFCRIDNLIPEPDDRRFDAANEMHPDGEAVLEVKITGCIPYWLSRMIVEAGCRLQSHSKYSNALERLDPVLHSMLAPNWRRRLAGSGDTEMEMVTAVPSPALETAGGPLVG
jgi:hypothetical protein